VRHGLAGPPPAKKGGDPDGKEVGAGHHGYWTQSNNFIRIVPCHGDDKVMRELESVLKQRATRPFTHLLVNLDGDDMDGAVIRDRRHSVLDRTRKSDPNAALDSSVIVLSGDARVVPVIWEAHDADAAIEGIPCQNTLERLVCAAICAAYPERGAIVTRWLASRGSTVAGPEHKAHAWSMMAGWFPDRGCDDFYSAVWQEQPIRAELEKRLAAYLHLVATIAA
jgi:hypothetical protein